MYMRFQKKLSNIKNIGRITKKFPLLHKILYRSYNFFIIYILPITTLYKKITLKKNILLKNFIGLQSIESYEIQNCNLSSRESFIKSYDSLNFSIGGWCIYHNCAWNILDKNEFPNNYSSNVGIKILINKKFKGEFKKDIYGLKSFGQHNSVKEVLRVGNRLFLKGFGPKIYDLIQINDPQGNKAYAYLVENIEGKYLTDTKKAKEFTAKITSDKWLEPALNTTFLVDDFSISRDSPNFINNNSSIKYIDFQALKITNEFIYLRELSKNLGSTSFGRKRIFANQNYTYQVLPIFKNGKRDTLKRWKVFDKLFSSSLISIKNKIVIDVGCNLGMNIYYCLNKGAKFVYGIDKKVISEQSNLILNALGATRYKTVGTDLKNEIQLQNLENHILDKIDIIFYCSIDGHIGYPNKFKNLNFEYIVHEGHVNTTIEENLDNMFKHDWLRKNLSEILYYTYINDGDSGSRPLLLAKK